MKFNFFKKKPEQRELEYISPFTDTGLLFKNYVECTPLFISAFFAAMQLITNSIAQLPIKIKKIRDNQRIDDDKNPLLKLFYENPFLTKFNIIKQLVWDMLLYGNGFLYIVRDQNNTPIRLIYLEHGSVNIQFQFENQTLKYLVNGVKGVPSTLYPYDIIHIHMNTYDTKYGKSIQVYGQKILKLAAAADKAAEDFFSSGMQINGILSFSHAITDKQKESIRSQWNSVHGTNAGGLAVLGADAKFEPVQQNAANSQLLETREFNLTEIARLFNINPILLGDLSHTSYSDIEQANIEFISHTLMPIIEIIQNELNTKLVKAKNVYIDLDENYLLKSTKDKEANYFTTLVNNGIITRNEARVALGYNPIEGGDDLIVAYTKIDDNIIGGNNDSSTKEQDDSSMNDDKQEDSSTNEN